MQETLVQSLGWEDPLEKEMATYSSILAWKISWREEPGGLQSMGSQSRTRLSMHTYNIKEPRREPRKSVSKGDTLIHHQVNYFPQLTCIRPHMVKYLIHVFGW